MEGSGSYRLKRGRDELSTPPASGNFPASDQRGTQNLLRCPWCPNGHLMRPAAKSPTNNSKEEGTHLCTNRSSCPCGAVIDQDRTMSFSCIDGSDLIRNFYNALDDHLETCQIVSQTPSQRDWAPWSIVAERSILFADPSNRKQRHSVDCSPPSLSPDPKGPVFYFLHCDNCGEKEFVC
ncbi:uncharacterized protein TEOVI_000096200 [Trypanosoma equiperdum]|uniref:Uncharacterized protein n=2 Tax=Trypanozoon TaxID=39700 RepID=Q57VZ3_TRYB2|nr:hypothetical protein, conserved [Trypanosoma brucei brucei TREU927]AAX70226.1 hypothetical protein, conserved [Trypanosoma brucei]AAZ13207.1 hypothetical protein, conserved [Trypanosoma brucei brucei TREU927]SCU69396.1 hypothetical protein, conserved [Trypanosoma equiperdum]